MTDTFFFGPNYYHPEFEFEDTALKETYWWGCASCMVQTGKDRDDYNTGAYSMGELRSVVLLAKLAETTLKMPHASAAQNGELRLALV